MFVDLQLVNACVICIFALQLIFIFCFNGSKSKNLRFTVPKTFTNIWYQNIYSFFFFSFYWRRMNVVKDYRNFLRPFRLKPCHVSSVVLKSLILSLPRLASSVLLLARKELQVNISIVNYLNSAKKIVCGFSRCLLVSTYKQMRLCNS